MMKTNPSNVESATFNALLAKFECTKNKIRRDPICLLVFNNRIPVHKDRQRIAESFKREIKELGNELLLKNPEMKIEKSNFYRCSWKSMKLFVFVVNKLYENFQNRQKLFDVAERLNHRKSESNLALIETTPPISNQNELLNSDEFIPLLDNLRADTASINFQNSQISNEDNSSLYNMEGLYQSNEFFQLEGLYHQSYESFQISSIDRFDLTGSPVDPDYFGNNENQDIADETQTDDSFSNKHKKEKGEK